MSLPRVRRRTRRAVRRCAVRSSPAREDRVGVFALLRGRRRAARCREAREAHRLADQRDVAEFADAASAIRCRGASPADPRTPGRRGGSGRTARPAFSSRSVHSAVVRWVKTSPIAALTRSRFSTRSGSEPSPGSCDQLRQAERLAQPRPHRLADRGDVEVAVLRLVHAGRHRQRVLVAMLARVPCGRSAIARPGSRASRSAIRAARSAPTGLRRRLRARAAQ